MRYAYRCDACRLTWDTRDDLHEAKADQKAHKYRDHGGARPDGQIIETPGIVDQLGSAVWAGVGAGARLIGRGVTRGLRSKSLREAMESESVRQAGTLLVTGVMILAVINWIIR
ncbi:hypothetical protein ACFXJ6_21140 [Streptomyces sp. NPDC059218]|uniref:hypothetical protein n=1 Tax=unclassified Streptomyces TaxID=2593676 RepID=UPI003688F5A3